MAFEDLQDQLKEQATELWSKIQDSPIYHNLRERYQTLSPAAQKGVLSGGVLIVMLILFSIPYSYYASSATAVEDYENNRTLIRRLLHASRIANDTSAIPQALSPEELKDRLHGELTNFSLLPEQIGDISDLDSASLGTSLAPKDIHQNGVSVALKKLNLKQVLSIGYQLQALNPSVKMAGLEMSATASDAHYFDVLFKLVIFSTGERKGQNE